jgi:hypothetical protein
MRKVLIVTALAASVLGAIALAASLVNLTF